LRCLLFCCGFARPSIAGATPLPLEPEGSRRPDDTCCMGVRSPFWRAQWGSGLRCERMWKVLAAVDFVPLRWRRMPSESLRNVRFFVIPGGVVLTCACLFIAFAHLSLRYVSRSTSLHFLSIWDTFLLVPSRSEWATPVSFELLHLELQVPSSLLNQPSWSLSVPVG
jgi:hypothetical protein